MIVFYKTIPFTSIQSEEEVLFIVYFENGQIVKCNVYLIKLLTFCMVQKSIYQIDTFIADSFPFCNEEQRKKILIDLLNLKIIQRADKFLTSKRNGNQLRAKRATVAAIKGSAIVDHATIARIVI